MTKKPIISNVALQIMVLSCAAASFYLAHIGLLELSWGAGIAAGALAGYEFTRKKK